MRAKAAPGRDVHVEACELFQQALDTDQIVQGERAVGIVSDEHVEIAVRAIIAACPRAENGEGDDTLLADLLGMRPQAGDKISPFLGT